MSKIDGSLFTNEGQTGGHGLGDCPDCGAALNFRRGRSGVFVGCSKYPACIFSKPLHDTQTAELTRIEGSVCPDCGEQLAIKKGQYGLFVGCSQYPECHHIEAIQKNLDTSVACPVCKTGKLIRRSNKQGKNFYACSAYPKCKYAVNDPPIQQQCEFCNWAILVKKRHNGEDVLQCPNRKCNMLAPS